jgi:hypothetical protein
MRANGHPADIHRAGMDIHHNLGGGRRVEMERADHSRLYYERGRPGYIAHSYAFHGHEYDRRSYYYNGRAYDRFYNHYEYRPGVYLDVYAPARYYGVGFYGWAYNPWAVAVPYAWGFTAAPWYGYYGAYFTPYPVYAAPALWLTDYLISASLAAAYEAHVAAQAQAEVAGTAPPAPLTPETKQMIADEVKRQVALEHAEAQANGSQQEADAKSSRGGVECPRLTTVSVPIEDLQDMQNHMRETIDMGLQELQAKQGKGGLPAAPPSATAPPVAALVAQGAPPPDPAGAQDLAKQAQESEKAEQEVLQSAAAPTGAANGAAPAP